MPTDGTDVKVLLRGRYPAGWMESPLSSLPVPGVHGGSRLRPRRGQEVSSAGREGRTGQRGERDPLPRHADLHGETGGQKSLHGLQGAIAVSLEQSPGFSGADSRFFQADSRLLWSRFPVSLLR